MKSCCKRLLALALALSCLGSFAAAQEPAGCPGVAPAISPSDLRPITWGPSSIHMDAAKGTSGKPAASAVSLGRPTSLDRAVSPAPANVVIHAFTPVYAGPARSPLQQTSYLPSSAPAIVRASSALLEDEPNSLLLPKEFAPLGELRLPPATLPLIGPDGKIEEGPRPVQALQPIPPKDKAKIIDVEKVEKIPLPPRAQDKPLPRIVDSVQVLQGPPVVYQNHSCLMDEHESSAFGYGPGPVSRWYGNAEWLLWWTKGFQLPPLVTTASPTDPERTRGALGFGNTQVIFGDTSTVSEPRSGGRFTLGYNFDDEAICGIEATFFFLGRQRDSFVADSSQYPVLGRPFFNINEGHQDRQLTTSPAILPGDVFKAIGSIQINSSSQLWGMEANARALLWGGCDYKITGLAGFRYLDLSDGLNITERISNQQAIPVNPGNLPINPGDQITVFDEFNTRNRFYGGQVGLNVEWQRGRWFFDTRFKIALGVTEQSVDINGSQTIVSPTTGQINNFRGGLYALPSNIGHHSQSRFAAVPETGLKIGYNVTENIRLYVGYDFLYWSSVMRPGDQIDQALDANQIPNSGGPFPKANQVRPIVPFTTTGFWAQGVNAGIEFRY